MAKLLILSLFVSLLRAYTLSGTYSLSSGSATLSSQTITASSTDVSGVYVYNTGVLTMNKVNVTTTGATSSGDDSSFYGLNAGVLASAGGTITMHGGYVSTTGTGANGVFSTGSGTVVTLVNTTIICTGQLGHGIDATVTGTIYATDLTVKTYNSNGAAVATDRGSGTITVTRGNFYTGGTDSPGIYSTGVITVTDAVFLADNSEAVVIEGLNSVTLTNTAVSGKLKRGVMLYQSMSGDAEVGTSEYTQIGGSLSSVVGPAFYVTNTDCVIVLSQNVQVTAASGVFLLASTDSWGTSGSNGGVVDCTINAVSISGNITADSISSITFTAKNHSTMSSCIKNAALSLDSTSTWTLTGSSLLTSLTDSSCVDTSELTISNIVGNGFSATYDSSLSANSYLNAASYSLVNGGCLVPYGTSAVCGSTATSSNNNADSSNNAASTSDTTDSNSNVYSYVAQYFWSEDDCQGDLYEVYGYYYAGICDFSESCVSSTSSSFGCVNEFADFDLESLFPAGYVAYIFYSGSDCADENFDYLYAATTACTYSAEFEEYVYGSCSTTESETSVNINLCTDDSCGECSASTYGAQDTLSCQNLDGYSTQMICGSTSSAPQSNQDNSASYGQVFGIILVVLCLGIIM